MGRGMQLTADSRLVPRIRMSNTILPLHCATSLKVAGSISHRVIVNFY